MTSYTISLEELDALVARAQRESSGSAELRSRIRQCKLWPQGTVPGSLICRVVSLLGSLQDSVIRVAVVRWLFQVRELVQPQRALSSLYAALFHWFLSDDECRFYLAALLVYVTRSCHVTGFRARRLIALARRSCEKCTFALTQLYWQFGRESVGVGRPSRRHAIDKLMKEACGDQRAQSRFEHVIDAHLGGFASYRVDREPFALGVQRRWFSRAAGVCVPNALVAGDSLRLEQIGDGDELAATRRGVARVPVRLGNDLDACVADDAPPIVRVLVGLLPAESAARLEHWLSMADDGGDGAAGERARWASMAALAERRARALSEPMAEALTARVGFACGGDDIAPLLPALLRCASYCPCAPGSLRTLLAPLAEWAARHGSAEHCADMLYTLHRVLMRWSSLPSLSSLSSLSSPSNAAHLASLRALGVLGERLCTAASKRHAAHPLVASAAGTLLRRSVRAALALDAGALLRAPPPSLIFGGGVLADTGVALDAACALLACYRTEQPLPSAVQAPANRIVWALCKALWHAKLDGDLKASDVPRSRRRNLSIDCSALLFAEARRFAPESADDVANCRHSLRADYVHTHLSARCPGLVTFLGSFISTLQR
jgi:Mis6